MVFGYGVGVGAGVELSNGRPSNVAVMALEKGLFKNLNICIL